MKLPMVLVSWEKYRYQGGRIPYTVGSWSAVILKITGKRRDWLNAGKIVSCDWCKKYSLWFLIWEAMKCDFFKFVRMVYDPIWQRIAAEDCNNFNKEIIRGILS